MILERCGHDATIEPDPTKPTGPYNRVADNSMAKRLLDWEPEVSFSDGLDRSIRWYFDSHERDAVAEDFEASLTERGLEPARKGGVETAGS
jgi:UDP-glucose 4-epimerase/GDP-L-fucose synthase